MSQIARNNKPNKQHKNSLRDGKCVIIFDRKDKDRTEQSPNKSESNNNLIISLFHSFHNQSGAYFSSFRRRINDKNNVKASITIEAAIALPLFIFMFFLMIYPLKIMNAERCMQNEMESLAKKMAIVEYADVTGSAHLKKDSSTKELISNMTAGIEEGGSLALLLAYAMEKPMRNIGFSSDTAIFSTEEGADPSMFHAELQYELEMPFSDAFSIIPIQKSLVVHRRAWVGSAGGRGRSKYGEDILEEEETDRTVYLGKTATVYHDDPNCHYLSNVMSSIDVSAMQDLRSADGGKYHACPSCKPGSAGTVYYFANGSAYHASEDCKAITAYARAVPYREVSEMKACSYCGKSHEGGKT